MGAGGSQTNRERKLWVWADQLGLSRAERLALSEYLLRRDVGSWRSLADVEVNRLLDALEGYHLIAELVAQRPPQPASASATADAGNCVDDTGSMASVRSTELR